jgi:hypothetical protein
MFLTLQLMLSHNKPTRGYNYTLQTLGYSPSIILHLLQYQCQLVTPNCSPSAASPLSYHPRLLDHPFLWPFDLHFMEADDSGEITPFTVIFGAAYLPPQLHSFLCFQIA